MPHVRSALLKSPILLVLAALAACDRGTPVVKRDSVSATITERTKEGAPAPTPQSVWNDSAGPVLLVAGETGGDAIVVLPSEADSAVTLARVANTKTDALLFGRSGTQSTGRLGAVSTSSDAECRAYAMQRAQGMTAWTVGFLGRSVGPIVLDSLESASPRDSTALTTEAARLGSSVTAVTSPSFDGLRFTVHEVRRFEARPGVQALVAHIIRRVNQEANPQEEQTLIVAERDSGVTSGPYRLVYADRTHGLEDQVVAPEVLAAVLIGGVPTLVVARDSDAGVAYELLERDATRHWRVRWISAPTRCG